MPLLCLLHFPSLSSVRFLFSVACVSSFSCFSFSSVRKGFTHREHKTFSVEKKKNPILKQPCYSFLLEVLFLEIYTEKAVKTTVTQLWAFLHIWIISCQNTLMVLMMSLILLSSLMEKNPLTCFLYTFTLQTICIHSHVN